MGMRVETVEAARLDSASCPSSASSAFASCPSKMRAASDGSSCSAPSPAGHAAVGLQCARLCHGFGQVHLPWRDIERVHCRRLSARRQRQALGRAKNRSTFSQASNICGANYGACTCCSSAPLRQRGRRTGGGGAGAAGRDHDVVEPVAGAAVDEDAQLGADQDDVQRRVEAGLGAEDQPVGVLPIQVQVRRHQVDIAAFQPATQCKVDRTLARWH